MLLVPIADVIDDLGFDSMEDIEQAVRSALHATETFLSSALGTSFRRTTRSDYFSVPKVGYAHGNMGTTSFKLIQGFVEPAGFTVSMSTSVSGVEDSPDDITSDVILDSEQGLVFDHNTVYDGNVLKVDYTAGFNVSSDDTTAFNYTEVPDWLRELAIVNTKIVLSDHPTLVQAQVIDNVDMLLQVKQTILASKSRYSPTSILSFSGKYA